MHWIHTLQHTSLRRRLNDRRGHGTRGRARHDGTGGERGEADSSVSPDLQLPRLMEKQIPKKDLKDKNTLGQSDQS